MFVSVRRAAAVAIFGFGIAAPAYAAGQMENAVQLYDGVFKACNYTADLIIAKNIKSAKDAVPQLFDLESNALSYLTTTQQAAAALAPSLGDAWAPTVTAMNELDGMLEAAKGIIGRGPVDADDIKAECATVNTAFATSMAASLTFGRDYWKLMSGDVENSKQLFDGAVSDAYETSIMYLAPGTENTDDGYTAVSKLHDYIGNLYELAYDAGNSATALTRATGDAWSPVFNAVRLFQVEVGVLESEVGQTEYSLSNLTSLYADLNAAMTRGYKDMQDFGTRLTALCDTCR